MDNPFLMAEDLCWYWYDRGYKEHGPFESEDMAERELSHYVETVWAIGEDND